MANKNLTLLLLVKGRHEFTERWLKYMLDNNFSYPIIIADGENDGVTTKLIWKESLKLKLCETVKWIVLWVQRKY